jgi:integrase
LKKLTVNSLFQNYLETKEISESTLAGYRSAWKNHVEDSIGQYKAVNVLPSDIKKLYSGLSQKGLAKNSIRRIHNLIRPVLEMAGDDGIIRKNPANQSGKITGVSRRKRKP